MMLFPIALIIFLFISAYDVWNINYQNINAQVLHGAEMDVYFVGGSVDANVVLKTDWKSIQTSMHSMKIKNSVCQYSYSSKRGSTELLGSVHVHMASSLHSSSVATLQFSLSQTQVFREMAWDLFNRNIDENSHIRFHCSSNFEFLAWKIMPIQIQNVQHTISIDLALFFDQTVNFEPSNMKSDSGLSDILTYLNISRHSMNWEAYNFTVQKQISSDLLVKFFSPLEYVHVHMPEMVNNSSLIN